MQESSPAYSTRPSVVIVGAGFGGLRVARGLRGAPFDLTIIDQHNYHTFVPLLYQVATAGLEPEEIAQPIRHILRGTSNVQFRLGRVARIDTGRRCVVTEEGSIRYDYVVLAAGSVTNFFGLETLERTASGLRNLDDAEVFRDRVLTAFETASIESDPKRQRDLMTIVLVGGGPTGVEMAGALAELRRHVLPYDYPQLHVSLSRIVLLEAGQTLLAGMDRGMQKSALTKLQEMGVDVRLQATERERCCGSPGCAPHPSLKRCLAPAPAVAGWSSMTHSGCQATPKSTPSATWRTWVGPKSDPSPC